VIEQAVVKANSAGSMYECLLQLIGGVVLLGTPHQGSKAQKWGSIMARLASVFECGESGLMDEVDEKSMKMVDLVSDFGKIMIRLKLWQANAVICFCENLRTTYVERVIQAGPWLQRHTSTMVRLAGTAGFPSRD
jgi:hypothetical protein